MSRQFQRSIYSEADSMIDFRSSTLLGLKIKGGSVMATTTDLGFTGHLFIMPFDHRGSFQEKLFGIKGRAPTPEETSEIALYKKTIYEGFKKAVVAGVPKEKAG